MAFNNRGSSLPGILAGVDLSALQHRFITIDATGRAVPTAVGARIDGVNEGNPLLDSPTPIQGGGAVVKVQASAAIALGASVASAANGEAVTAVAGNYIGGICVSAAGAAGELCSVWMTFPGIAP